MRTPNRTLAARVEALEAMRRAQAPAAALSLEVRFFKVGPTGGPLEVGERLSFSLGGGETSSSGAHP